MTFQKSNFASGSNAEYLDKVYEQFVQDPQSVHPSWAYFFQGMEFARQQDGARVEGGAGSHFDTRISHLISGYRNKGHLSAQINPLATEEKRDEQLDLQYFGFDQTEMDKEFPTEGLMETPSAPLRQILKVLKTVYCSSIGVEYMHMERPEEEKWFQSKMEPNLNDPNLKFEDRKRILEYLSQAELFEKFLHTKYIGQKRFSLEGSEVLIPALGEIIEYGPGSGVNEVVIGMPHRGRLNVLTNILNKSYQMVFTEFEDNATVENVDGSGDVKYHKGFSSKLSNSEGKELSISLTANPSHLEAVNPVVMGRIRGKQDLKGDKDRKKILSVLIHGDAAMAGQGVVYECFQMAGLEGYDVGGTLHIVVNNQIGFTTKPHDSRTSLYCSDVAKVVGAPVLHVNGDDPEAVVHSMRIALDYLQTFNRDVVVDLICFRRHGHNEGDEPMFTSPLDYKVIKTKPSVREIYRDKLIQHGHVEKDMATELEQTFRKDLSSALEEIRKAPAKHQASVFDGVWNKFRAASTEELFKPIKTGIASGLLKELAEKITNAPEGFHMLPKLNRVISERSKLLTEKNVGIDWGLAEHLAFGSLLWEGHAVRLSGQDCERGTFSQRHAVWIDCENENKYTPLKNLKEGQSRFSVYNSPLNEYAVMGYEFGYSLSYPSALVLWEAQFGDFANGAQIIIDQFFCTAEQKWSRYSGLVLLLPHGQEGQGPEHSSARIERFLTNSAQNNIQVAMPTTPAQYFHLMRRQVLREWRRPLVVGTPKAYLRHPLASSKIQDFTKGHFQEVLKDPDPVEKPKFVAFCSGKVYFDIQLELEKRGLKKDFNLHRLEQIYPFHRTEIRKLLDESGTNKVVWVQEEPLNQGPAIFIRGRMLEILPKGKNFEMIGRPEAASPAVGTKAHYTKDFNNLMDQFFAAAKK